MYPNIRVKKRLTKVFIEFRGTVYVPGGDTALGQHDVVDVHLREDDLIEVYVKHHPTETWIPLKEES